MHSSCIQRFVIAWVNLPWAKVQGHLRIPRFHVLQYPVLQMVCLRPVSRPEKQTIFLLPFSPHLLLFASDHWIPVPLVFSSVLLQFCTCEWIVLHLGKWTLNNPPYGLISHLRGGLVFRFQNVYWVVRFFLDHIPPILVHLKVFSMFSQFLFQNFRFEYFETLLKSIKDFWGSSQTDISSAFLSIFHAFSVIVVLGHIHDDFFICHGVFIIERRCNSVFCSLKNCRYIVSFSLCWICFRFTSIFAV